MEAGAGAQAQPHGSILPLRNPKPSANAAAGLGLLWALTNGPPPTGGTPAGEKAPHPRCQGPPPAPRPCDLRGTTPKSGRDRTVPATAFQAQPGPVPGVVPEVGGLCLAR